jgi:DnaA family protein
VSTQLPLDLRLRDGSSFANFLASGNEEVRARLRALVAKREPGNVFLWGERAAGKTHLLEAACREIQDQGGLARYVPLSAADAKPAMLEDAEHADLVCLDDVEAVAGNRDWEAALFAVIERVRDQRGRLIAAGIGPPGSIGLRLPDLATRLAWGTVYQVRALDDDGKIAAIRLRAKNRGLEVPLEAARYILNRYPRDMVSLFALLERIDVASLATRRRVTIPFLRSLEPGERAR